MLHYPEVQARARKEIDTVTGGNRLPDFEDRVSLPYIELIMAELFRWAPPAPLGEIQFLSQLWQGIFTDNGISSRTTPVTTTRRIQRLLLPSWYAFPGG